MVIKRSVEELRLSLNGADDALFVILWLVNGWAAWTAGRAVLASERVRG